MKVTLVKLGKPAFPEIPVLVAEYAKRLGAFCSFEVMETKESSFKFPNKSGDFVVLWDEGGENFSSKEFAGKIQRWMDDPSIKSLYFIIGGPYGFNLEQKKSAQFTLSLSRLTLQGDLAWLAACEQIYRAFTILRKMPYHH